MEARNRLEALAETGLLDSETEERFDRLTRMVARTLCVPISLFSLVDDRRQFFKSAFGLGEPLASRRETPLSHAFCRHVVADDSPFRVDNAYIHPVVVQNPAMLELGIAAYLGVPVRTPRGHVLGALCAIDVSPRVWSQDALTLLEDFAALVEGEIDLRAEVLRRRAAEEMLTLAVDATGLGLWWLDRPGGEVTCSEKCKALLGLTNAAPFPYADWLARVHPHDRAETDHLLRAAFEPAGEGLFQHEFRLLRPDGEMLWVAATGQTEKSESAAEAGSPRRLVGTVRNITNRKRTEQLLAQNERRWREILNTMPQMVWSALPDGRSDYYNDRWYEYTGTPHGSTDIDEMRALLHPDDEARVEQGWQHALASGEPFDIEGRLRRHDGQYRWTLGRALPMRNAAGEIERWFGTCTDIHDLKVAEEQRELIARELSHRIKNIFAVVNSLVTLSARATRWPGRSPTRCARASRRWRAPTTTSSPLARSTLKTPTRPACSVCWRRCSPLTRRTAGGGSRSPAPTIRPASTPPPRWRSWCTNSPPTP
ncbi:MAG: PAS domain-containing protein [Methylacidiphilales bacterium]|nr:PAS domain-containing protein [Candidatus Methylacidiphilales bacterium]